MTINKRLVCYTSIAVLILLGIPVGMWALGVGLHYNIPTPGEYAMSLFQSRRRGTIAIAFVVGGFVNSVCGCVLICVLVAVIARWRRNRNLKTSGGHS
jgi:hypothetical protein